MNSRSAKIQIAILFLIFCSSLFSQEIFQVNKAALNTQDGILTLSFSSVPNENTLGSNGFVTLYPSLGGPEDTISFYTPFSFRTGTDGSSIQFILSDAQRAKLENFGTIGDYPLLDIGEGSFSSASGTQIPNINAWPVEIQENISDENSSQYFLNWASLNLSRGLLELHFNNPRDISYPLNPGIVLYNESIKIELSGTGVQFEENNSPYDFWIRLSGTQIDSIKNSLSTGSNLKLDLNNDFSKDIYGNINDPEYEFFVETQHNINNLELLWVNLNWDAKLLEFEFNNKISSISPLINGNLKLETATNSLELINLVPISDSQMDDFRYRLELDLNQLEEIKSWSNLENELSIYIPSNFFMDEFGNTNSELYHEVNRPKQDTLSLHLIWAAINHMEGMLELEFNNPLLNGSFSPAAIINIYKNGSQVLNLSNLENSLIQSENDRSLVFKLDNIDLTILKPDSLSYFEIEINSGIVSDIYNNQSLEEFRRPLNHFRNSDGFNNFINYYPMEGKIVFDFPESIDDSKLNFSGKISFSSDKGGTLTFSIPTPWVDISPNSNDGHVVIVLNSADRDALNSILDPSLETLISMESGIFYFMESQKYNQAVLYEDNWHLYIHGENSDGHQDPVFIFDNLADDQIWLEDSSYQFSIILENESGLNAGEEIGVELSLLPGFISLDFKGQENGQYVLKFSSNPTNSEIGSHILDFKLFPENTVSTTGNSSDEFIILSKNVSVVAKEHEPVFSLISQQSGGAISLQYNLSDLDTPLDEYAIKLSLKKEGETLVPKSQNKLEQLYFPLPDGEYQAELQILATDGKSYVDSKTITVSGITTRSIPAGSWSMVGILGQKINTSDLGDATTLAFWKDDGEESNLFSRYLMDSKIPFLERGKGYWIYNNEDINLPLTKEQLLDSAISIKLVYGALGWNQISNPYPYSIDVSSSGLDFFKWDPTTSDVINVSGILEPGVAYWVNVNEEQILSLKAQPYFKSNAAKKLSKLPADVIADLKLSLSAKGKKDSFNYLKILANESPNNFKSLEAPKMGSHISLYFKSGKKSGLKYNSIGTYMDTNGDIWQSFYVKSENLGTQNSQLSIEGLENLKAEGYISYIADKNEIYSLSEGNSIPMKISSQEKEITLILTKNPNLKEELEHTKSSINNYPNPVRGQTTFEVSVPFFNGSYINAIKEHAAQIDIFNISGEKVSEIGLLNLSPGISRVVWESKDKNGKKLAPGSYYYVLKMENFIQTKKMLILP